MPFKQIGLILVIVFIFTFGLTQIVQAGFGVTSPYIENDVLVPGAHYEKEILIIRGDPIEDWKAEMSIDVPGAADWFSFDKGKEFILPKGVKQVPLLIKVDVPQNAKFDRYQGAIRIRTLPVNQASGVSIALGARINVDIEVVEEGVLDFIVQHVRLFDIEEGWKIKMGIEIKNTGNVGTSPSKISLDVYDSADKNKIVSLENNGLGDKVKPFETKELIAEFDHQLKEGPYWVYFKIFKKDELVKEGKLSLSILPPGTLPPQNQLAGSFAKLLSKENVLLPVIIVIVILIIAFVIIFKKIKKKRK